MIRTSYFSKHKDTDGVSIAVGTPNWFKGDKYSDLFPTWDMINEYKKTGDWERYENRYRQEILSQLDPDIVYNDLNGKVLLCWERAGENCHRRIVAMWLLEETGHPVNEV